MQREAAAEASRRGLETRAQEAMRLVIEARKTAAAEQASVRREAERDARWEQRVARRKKKHRGK